MMLRNEAFYLLHLTESHVLTGLDGLDKEMRVHGYELWLLLIEPESINFMTRLFHNSERLFLSLIVFS